MAALARFLLSVWEEYRTVSYLGCVTGIWVNFRKLPRVSEVATNHWIFLGVIGHLTLFDFIPDLRLRKMSFLLI